MENLFTSQEIAGKLGLSKNQLNIKIIQPMFAEIEEKEFAQKIDGKWLFNFERILAYIQKGNEII